MKGKARPRADDGILPALAATLKAFLTHPKKIGQYDRLSKEAISNCAGLLVSLKKLQGNMAFTHVMMNKACEQVALEKRIAGSSPTRTAHSLARTSAHGYAACVWRFGLQAIRCCSIRFLVGHLSTYVLNN